ncbi:hypothetical protein [Escherichia coli]|uniref:hypothetical protein n=1 Tax=Escherichia coli TaxID=562 RepID=UPI00333F83C4
MGTPAKSKNNPVRGTYSALPFTINTVLPHRSDDLNICIVDNEFLRIDFCIAWTAYYFLSLFKYFVKYFFPLNREDLLNLMELAKDSPDAKQELLGRLLSRKRMTGRDEMDIKRILKTKEALNNIRKFLDKKGNK